MRILDAVARTGSIGRAAELLEMTGPAVSQQLRKLEAEAKVKVVEPAGRGIRLTCDGEVIARYAASMAALMQEATNTVHRGRPLAGVIRMGGVASALRTIVATELSRLRSEHPGIEVHVEDGEAIDHVQRLAAGHLDLVVAESWSPNPLRLPKGLRCRRLSSEDAYVAVPSTHPRAAATAVSIGELAGEAWTTCAAGSDAHTALTQAAHADGADINVRFHVADHLTQVEFVHAGLAVACVPESARRHAHSRDVSFLPLTSRLQRELLLVTPHTIGSRATAHLVRTLAHASTTTPSSSSDSSAAAATAGTRSAPGAVSRA